MQQLLVEASRVESQQCAKTCCECIHTAHCVAGARAGPLFARASCTPLLLRALPVFLHISTISFLSKLCLSVSPGMPALPLPLALRSAPLPPTGSVAWLPGGCSLLTSGAAGIAWWCHSSDLRARGLGGWWWKRGGVACLVGFIRIVIRYATMTGEVKECFQLPLQEMSYTNSRMGWMSEEEGKQ